MAKSPAPKKGEFYRVKSSRNSDVVFHEIIKITDRITENDYVFSAVTLEVIEGRGSVGDEWSQNIAEFAELLHNNHETYHFILIDPEKNPEFFL